jgi:hypothetical protein
VLRDVDLAGLGIGASFVGGSDNEIHRSDLLGATNGAVEAKDSPGLVIADSQLQAVFFDAGALIESDRARVIHNRFVPPDGLDFENRLPALKLTGNGARITDNVVTGVWSSGFVLAGSNNVVVDNELSGLFGDGILVSPFSSGVVLRDNRVEGMADDGIDVQAAGTRLEANRSNDNGDWGVDAVPGVTDLAGNGQAAQCRNVACNQ